MSFNAFNHSSLKTEEVTVAYQINSKNGLNKKEVVVYDYVDNQVPMLAKMANKRTKGYNVIGYEIADS